MPQTVDVTTQGTEIRVTREFDAPRDLVFEAHTRPELVKRWMLGPPGWTMPVCDMDVRVGGRYRYVWRSESDGGQFGFTGEFREISAPERLVHTERQDGDGGAPGDDGEALCTLTLTEQGSRTLLTQTMRFASAEIRDQVLQTGMAEGMGSSYDQLEALLEERRRA